MGGIFSKKERGPKSAPVSDQDNAILVSCVTVNVTINCFYFQALKTQRDKMKQMVKRKENCLEKERQLAKQLLKDGKKE